MKAEEAVTLVIAGEVARGEVCNRSREVRWDPIELQFQIKDGLGDHKGGWVPSACPWRWPTDFQDWKILPKEPELARLLVESRNYGGWVTLPSGTKWSLTGIFGCIDQIAGFVYQLPDGREVELQKAPPVWCTKNEVGNWCVILSMFCPNPNVPEERQLAKLTHVLWLKGKGGNGSK